MATAAATPGRRSLARPRPSLGQSISTLSTPNLLASVTPSQRPPLPSPQPPGVRTAFARKASLNQLSAGSVSKIPGENQDREAVSSPFTMHPTTPATKRTVSGDTVGNANLEVGDAVDVPGGMHGVVKFIGEVRGKKGIFAGVELSREFAARGKNDGDVEGWVLGHGRLGRLADD